MPPPPPPPGRGSTPPPAVPPPPGFGGPPPPPGAVATAPGSPPYGYAAPPIGGERAGFGVRLGGYLLDGLLYGLLMAVFAIPSTVLFFSAFDDCYTFERLDGTTDIECPGGVDGGALAGGIALLLVGFLLVAFIYVRALGKSGQTWGRKIVGIKVIGERTGEPIGFGRALGRQLFASFISGQVFYLGYLWMLWDDKKQTWHDKVVNSIVVKL